MQALAVVMHEPERLELSQLTLTVPGDDDVVVAITSSGISTGTEKLLWQGRMPHFPGMGYPLVPGYESVGRVSRASGQHRVGDHVFVPGAKCFGEVRGLFGGAASHLVVPAARVIPIDAAMGERGVLLALAATAKHAFAGHNTQPDLIIGHGVLGRLVARLAVLAGASPTVWEIDPLRAEGAVGYVVVHPDQDDRRDYSCICDASGEAGLLDKLVGRLAQGGEIVLAGFYTDRINFAFAPAFMREARLRIASQFLEADLVAVRNLYDDGRLSLDGLITHHCPPAQAADGYRQAFTDPSCLKMVLNWSSSI